MMQIVPVLKWAKMIKPFKMVSNEDIKEIEKCISPTRCLYSDYATTIDKFKEENGVLLMNYELEDLGDDAGYKLYSEFSEEKDG